MSALPLTQTNQIRVLELHRKILGGHRSSTDIINELDLNMTSEIRPVFFISDGTGLTAEGLGQAPTQPIRHDTVREDNLALHRQRRESKKSCRRDQCSWYRMRNCTHRFDTIVNQEVRDVRMRRIFSRHDSNIPKATRARTRQGVVLFCRHESRCCPRWSIREAHRAINFALDNDDGARIRYYDQADLILVGVSRSGKTPTSLYLAMQYG